MVEESSGAEYHYAKGMEIKVKTLTFWVRLSHIAAMCKKEGEKDCG